VNAPDLEALLVHAKDHGEVLLFIPPDGWELVPEPPPDCPVRPHFLDDGDELLDAP
jgi:hypothetical protein